MPVSGHTERMVIEDMSCWAGRLAFNEGNPTWQVPCRRSMDPTHVVTDPTVKDAPVIVLCTFHYEDVLAQGLIDDPSPSLERQARAAALRSS